MDRKIATGYKQTEVGIIPEDWTTVKLSDVCIKIQDGTHFSPKVGGHDYLYITSKNIRFGYLDISSASQIDQAQHQKIYKRCDVKKGDLLLTKDGANTGNAAINNINEEFSLLSSVAFLRFQSSKYCTQYFLQQILSSYSQRQIHEAMSGNAITRLTLEKIKKLRFSTPSTKTEQTAISTALSDVDALISGLDDTLAKKRLIKQGAMQELLTGKKRLAGFSGDWEVRKLGNVATLKARIGWQGLTTAEYRVTGDYHLITGTEFINGFIDWDSCFYVDYERYKQDKNIQIKENDILVTKDGTIGKVAFINKTISPATLNSGIFVIRPINYSFHPQFFYYILMSETFASFLSQLSAGSTINHLYQKDFFHFKFNLPSTVEEQTAIAKTLSDMDSEIEALEKRRTKTLAIKQGMMQELLTGRTRLV